jgi:hypothetical protein
MTKAPKVDYDEIQHDYAYFLTHSTETAAQVAALVRKTRPFISASRRIEALASSVSPLLRPTFPRA